MRTLTQLTALAEEALVPALTGLGAIPEELLEPMAYSLSAGGKRLRPVLLLAAHEALGGDAADALPYACALEMIHTYSLIHDDLPAMDNDDTRRGRPSCHVAFGEDMAILAGDGLLSAAMELMLKAALGRQDLNGARAAHAIAARCGVTGMVAGQTADVKWEGSAVTEDKVRYIHQHKTADLLTAPVEAGFLLAGCGQEELRLGQAYGTHLGLAFQMVDDLLDEIGDERLMGKKTGLDSAAGKLTWVALRGIEGTRADAREQVEAAVSAVKKVRGDTQLLQEIALLSLERVM